MRSWSFYRLAKESDITYSTLCTMLHKATSPSIPTLIKICSGLGITMTEFFDTENERTLLSPAQKEHLDMWSQLSPKNQQAAENYIRYLLSEQKK